MTSARPLHLIGIRGCLRCRRIMLAERSVDHQCWAGKAPARRLRRQIAERDRWICQLCELPIDAELPRSNPLGPSLDHRLPKSDGGSHAPDNLHLAHAICNWVRNSRPLDEIKPAEHRARIEAILARINERDERQAREREEARREGIRRRRRGQRQRRHERLAALGLTSAEQPLAA